MKSDYQVMITVDRNEYGHTTELALGDNGWLFLSVRGPKGNEIGRTVVCQCKNTLLDPLIEALQSMKTFAS